MASLVLRSSVYYIQHTVSGKARRVSAGTGSLQVAKEKLWQFESGRARGDDLPLPTKTSIADALTAYVWATKTAKSSHTDYLLLAGHLRPCLRRRPRHEPRRVRQREEAAAQAGPGPPPQSLAIEANAFEQITTADIAAFIGGQVSSRGLAPKTANRYREILTRLFNWAMTQRGVRMPRDKNPAAAVERYREHAPEITFLTLAQIDEQLEALAGDPRRRLRRTACHGPALGMAPV